ncbi:septum formation initiator family protein [soil metagenome]
MNGERRGASYGAAIFGAAVIALLSYLSFAALQGEYGLFRLFQVEAQALELREDVAALEAERRAVAILTRGLSAETLDLDLLDERARAVLGLGRPDEVLVR